MIFALLFACGGTAATIEGDIAEPVVTWRGDPMESAVLSFDTDEDPVFMWSLDTITPCEDAIRSPLTLGVTQAATEESGPAPLPLNVGFYQLELLRCVDGVSQTLEDLLVFEVDVDGALINLN